MSLSASLKGLSESDAQRRLAEFGPNELSTSRGRTLSAIVLDTMREPMFLLLVGAAVLYLALGDVGEGAFLLAGATASIGLVIAQEARSERALAALRVLAQPSARVIRDGIERRIPARSLVNGDLLLVGEGERLPADGVVVGGDVLSVDESLLTGESAPVTKPPCAEPALAQSPEPGLEISPFVFAGAMVVRGQAAVLVTQTGSRSALGKIGASLAAIVEEPTPLQRAAGRMAGLLGGVALAFCGVVALAYGLARGDWINGALSGITFAIALIPEEFPMVLAVFLALGAWRLARHQVLVRRSAVIESLGAATVLCVDKTGTLTQNQMQVARLWSPDEEIELDNGGLPLEATAEVLRLAALASSPRPVDPMDRAIRSLQNALEAPVQVSTDEPLRTWPLQPDRLAMVQLWRDKGGGSIAAAKGAPEAIFRLCGLADHETHELRVAVERYAALGLRVLAVGSARGAGDLLRDPSETRFTFAGLVGFIDPVRPDAAAALAEARAAGVKVIMITGDHPKTALAVAKSVGIECEAGVMTGADLARLTLDELRVRLAGVRVFARVNPEQKLRLVEALKANDEVVAMTGDGVNDAPALEAAHIGVAMGQRGTDIAREAADLVLLDDSFASIVGGVRLGRRIFANLRQALTYITAIHVPIAGVALAPVLLGLPPILFPMHVVLLELVIDPTCALVFEVEPSTAGAMRRPPRPKTEPLFGPRQIAFGLLQGASILVVVLGLYAWTLRAGYGEAPARGAAFAALVVGNLVLALRTSAASANLFAPHRRVFWVIAAAVSAALALIFNVPPLARMFEVSATAPMLLLMSIVGGVVAAGWTVIVPARRR